jgi:hypothetical protein
MRKLVLTVTLTLVTGMTVWSFSGGPPDGATGAPGEVLCTDCHTSFPANSGDGQLTLLGLPDAFDPGQTYTLTVSLADPGQQRWGFELAVKDDNDQEAGTITVTDAVNTQASVTGGITYLKHTSTGTQNGTPDGPVTWSFDWTAPSKGRQVAIFYAAGNAANGNGNNQGDYIYNISRIVSTRDVPSTQIWGQLVLVGLILGSAIFLIVRRRVALRRV